MVGCSYRARFLGADRKQNQLPTTEGKLSPERMAIPSASDHRRSPGSRCSSRPVYPRGECTVYCATFHHHNAQRCIFNYRFAVLETREDNRGG